MAASTRPRMEEGTHPQAFLPPRVGCPLAGPSSPPSQGPIRRPGSEKRNHQAELPGPRAPPPRGSTPPPPGRGGLGGPGPSCALSQGSSRKAGALPGGAPLADGSPGDGRSSLRYRHDSSAAVAGSPRGHGQNRETTQERRKKEANKSTRANHNRRTMADRKRNKGMIPS